MGETQPPRQLVQVAGYPHVTHQAGEAKQHRDSGSGGRQRHHQVLHALPRQRNGESEGEGKGLLFFPLLGHGLVMLGVTFLTGCQRTVVGF